jgi:hypothetical protein
MAIVQGKCTSFLSELLAGTHVIGTDVLKIALYTSSASLTKDTTVYSATNEVVGTGYVAGGATLSGVTVGSSDGVVWIDFNDVTWPASTLTARGALVYNSSKANRAIWVLDFGSDKVSSASTFRLTLPIAAATTALLRFE